MKIVLAPAGSHGDIRPVSLYGKRLREAGHDVVGFAPPESRPWFEHLGIPFTSNGLNIRELTLHYSRHIVDRPLSSVPVFLSLLRRELKVQFERLLAFCRGADCIIGAGLQAAGSSVAEYYGVPYRLVIGVPQIIASPDHPPVFWPCPGSPRAVNYLLWRIDRVAGRLAFGGAVSAYRSSAGLPRRHVYTCVMRRTLLTCYPAFWRSSTTADIDLVQCPFWHDSESGEPAAEPRAFVESGNPPVYFGFGSMPGRNAKATERAIAETVDKTGIRAVVCRGWAGLRETLEHPRIRVIEHADHGRLFPLCAAVVHHGGAGTTSAAARAGVPQVIVPHLLDQYYWGRKVRELGIGPRPVPRSRLSAATLTRAVRNVLEDSGIRQRAVELGARLRMRDGLREAVERFGEWF